MKPAGPKVREFDFAGTGRLVMGGFRRQHGLSCRWFVAVAVTASVLFVGVRVEPVGATAAGNGGGYWLVARDGGVFAFGDAGYYGNSVGVISGTGGTNTVAIASSPDGDGYWLVAANGAVGAFGDATSFGSAAGLALHAPIVGLAATPDGNGYWEVAADGGVFSFGDARFYGSLGGTHLDAPVDAIAAK